MDEENARHIHKDTLVSLKEGCKEVTVLREISQPRKTGATDFPHLCNLKQIDLKDVESRAVMIRGWGLQGKGGMGKDTGERNSDIVVNIKLSEL